VLRLFIEAGAEWEKQLEKVWRRSGVEDALVFAGVFDWRVKKELRVKHLVRFFLHAF